MQNLKVTEVHGIRVLTTRQIADMYGTSPEIINNNFVRNKTKYLLEKHYISVEGEEMRQLRTSHQFDGELKRVSRAYFWTEKGALLHAKSLNTDKAWQVYDYLVDFYFRAKEEQPNLPIPRKKVMLSVTNPIPVFKALLQLAEKNGVTVNTYDFESSSTSLINGNSIGIRNGLSFNQVVCELAYSLAHRFIHSNDGDMIGSAAHNVRAERAAQMMIDALDFTV